MSVTLAPGVDIFAVKIYTIVKRKCIIPKDLFLKGSSLRKGNLGLNGSEV
jgi:hypothetical protein